MLGFAGIALLSAVYVSSRKAEALIDALVFLPGLALVGAVSGLLSSESGLSALEGAVALPLVFFALKPRG